VGLYVSVSIVVHVIWFAVLFVSNLAVYYTESGFYYPTCIIITAVKW